MRSATARGASSWSRRRMPSVRSSRHLCWLALLVCGAAAVSVDAEEVDADGTTALHWAAHRGDVAAARALLAAGAAVDAENRYGVRPTYLAAENGDAAMMRVLL